MKRAAESTVMPFPDRPAHDAPHLLFWLTESLRDQARHEALEIHYTALIIKLPRSQRDGALISAVGTALRLLSDQAHDSHKTLRNHGGLLFAWHGTTALQLLPQAKPAAVPA